MYSGRSSRRWRRAPSRWRRGRPRGLCAADHRPHWQVLDLPLSGGGAVAGATCRRCLIGNWKVL